MKHLARKAVQNLEPYLSARRLGGHGDVWLNANESPLENQYQGCDFSLNRYGSCQPKELIKAYADYTNLPKAQILTCRGADEAIELLIKAFCEPSEDSIIYCPPTYGMYAIGAQSFGVDQKQIPLTDNWQLDLKQIEKNLDTTKLCFICRPNNPTGNLIDKQDLIHLLNITHNRALVVVDEAYIDFCPEVSMKDDLAKHPNLVILRTLSKAFALAGLRCGFCLANEDVIDVLLKVIAPYPVPIPVEKIAIQALSTAGIAKMRRQSLDLMANRAYLQAGLSMIEGVQVFDSWGNYLLVYCKKSEDLFKLAWEKGFIFRQTQIENCIRLTIGTREECEKTLSFIRQALMP